MTPGPKPTMLVMLAAACVVLVGCQPRCPETMVSLETLISEHNRNAAQIPRLWARVKIQATLTDKDSGLRVKWGSTSSAAPSNGLLLLAKGDDPLGWDDFVLIGRETAGLEVFRVGSSAAEGVYYFWSRFGEQGAALWGHCELAGAPGVRTLPIDPQQLLTVLGVCSLPTDLTKPPTVALTMETTPGRCAYVVTTIDRQPITNRLLFTREMHFRWSDTEPRRPFLVNFFDERGLRIMTATMKTYRAAGAGAIGDDGAAMPADVTITWPEKGVRVRIVLTEVSLSKAWDRAACRFRDHLPSEIPPQRIIQVDEHLTDGGAAK